jgi:hypothetical protein
MGGDRMQHPRLQPRQATEWVPCRTCSDGEVWRVVGDIHSERCPKCQARRDAHLKQKWER